MEGSLARNVLKRAFTLLELLIVVAIIAVLAALLLPALVQGKEGAKRTACRSNLHQLTLALHTYGNDQRDLLPPGLCDYGFDYPPVVSTNTWKIFTQYIGSPRAIGCPGLPKPFVMGGFSMPPYGYVLGFVYLGGHTNIEEPPDMSWISPLKFTDAGSLALMIDMNVWSPGYQSVAPHGATGPVVQNGDASNPNAEGATPKELGALGGNIGTLDGAVTWKQINRMKSYQLSSDAAVFGNW